LKAKCERYGINFTEVDEAYTSKADALALEPIGKPKPSKEKKESAEEKKVD